MNVQAPDAPTASAADSSRPGVVYVLPDKMGGLTNIIAGLLQHRHPDGFWYHAVLTRRDGDRDEPYGERLEADSQTTVRHRLPRENLHAVLRRLEAALPPGPGVLVANDLLELALLSARDVGRTAIQILHGDFDYYYDLAARHEDVIDAFVVYSRAMEARLCARLPHRRETIFYLPYGVAVPDRSRQPATGPIRLIFAGRLEQGQKGILDLPAIDHRLRESGVEAVWTIVGDGPDAQRLQTVWKQAPHVRWLGRRSRAEVCRLYLDQDVFLLPTRAEGLPVAMLEAMAAGVVPVVSDIQSGIPELVHPGLTGERPPVGDVAAFAGAVAALARNRDRLEHCSAAARRIVAERHDVRDRTPAYQALFARWRELRRPRSADARLPYGSRLDRPWMPNFVTKAMRDLARR